MISKISKIKQSMFSFFNPPILKNKNNTMSTRSDQLVQADFSKSSAHTTIDETYLNKFSTSVLLSMLKELQQENNQWNSLATRKQGIQDTQRENYPKNIDLSTSSHEELVKVLATLMSNKNKREIATHRITA